MLYHWRCHPNSTASNPESKLYAFTAGSRAIMDHYKRVGIEAEKVEKGVDYGIYHTTFKIKDDPLVSVIIPNKDHTDAAPMLQKFFGIILLAISVKIFITNITVLIEQIAKSAA